MSRAEEIEEEIESLDDEEFARLKRWLASRNREEWDRRIESDPNSGNLDSLIEGSIQGESKRKLSGV